MKLSEAVVPISYAKSHTAELLTEISRDRKPVVITQNGRARAVILDLESYEETQESLALLKIVAQGREDVRHRRYRPFRQAFARVRKETANEIHRQPR
jgi:prevent-host-death family protein